MDSRMHFTFSDTIAGSVVALRGGRGHVHAARRSTAASSTVALTEPDVRRGRSATSARPYVDATGQMRDMLDRGRILFAYGDLLPRGRRATSSRRKRIVFVGRTRARLRLRAPDWWVKQIRRDRRLLHAGAVRPDGNIDFARVPHADRPRGRQAAGRRARRPTRSRGWSTGWRPRTCMTGEDRFLEAAETGTEYLREHMRTSTRARASPTGARHRHRRRARRRRSSPPSSATTTTRSRPTSRSTRSPARRRPSASPATRASRATST